MCMHAFLCVYVCVFVFMYLCGVYLFVWGGVHAHACAPVNSVNNLTQMSAIKSLTPANDRNYPK